MKSILTTFNKCQTAKNLKVSNIANYYCNLLNLICWNILSIFRLKQWVIGTIKWLLIWNFVFGKLTNIDTIHLYLMHNNNFLKIFILKIPTSYYSKFDRLTGNERLTIFCRACIIASILKLSICDIQWRIFRMHILFYDLSVSIYIPNYVYSRELCIFKNLAIKCDRTSKFCNVGCFINGQPKFSYKDCIKK